MSLNSINFSNGYVNNLGKSYLKSKVSSSSARSEYFKSWETTYKNLKFSVGDSAFGKPGVGNVTISKEQLWELEGNAQKRTEFEKTLKDCDKTASEMKNRGGSKLVSQGFFYTDEGELQGWTVAKTYTGTNQKYITTLNKDNQVKWFNAMTLYTKASDPYASNWQRKFGR